MIFILLALLHPQQDLQGAIDDAIRAGQPRVVIPAGVHKVPSTRGRWCRALRE